MYANREQLGPRLTVEELRQAAAEMRAINMVDIFAAGSGHPGGTLSIMDIAAALYLRVLNHDPQNPTWPARDRVIVPRTPALQRLGVIQPEAHPVLPA